jgi:hypothetical protein
MYSSTKNGLLTYQDAIKDVSVHEDTWTDGRGMEAGVDVSGAVSLCCQLN